MVIAYISTYISFRDEREIIEPTRINSLQKYCWFTWNDFGEHSYKKNFEPISGEFREKSILIHILIPRGCEQRAPLSMILPTPDSSKNFRSHRS
jgi:hypothetical protein